MKNIFTIDADHSFLDSLATKLWHETQGDGFRLSRYLILLPTRRACRHLGHVFTKIAAGKPVLLPRMRPIGDVDEDEIVFADEANLDLAPAIDPLKRLMLLTQQVQKRDPLLSWDQAALGANALARFLDQVQIEQCDIEALPTLVREQELAEHWQQTILFLEIVTKNWPLILKAHGSLDPAERRNGVLKAQAELWRAHPPSFPIIAAGSTGSIPATAALLEVVAAMPLGAVVLPGLDRAIDNEAWADIDETHPQYNIKRLLDRLACDRDDVQAWHGAAAPPSARVRLLSEAMRPANSTEAWRRLEGQLEARSSEGLTSLLLDHPQEEAQVIALRLLSVLHTPDKTAALVTPDRALATRVVALLRRWGIRVDDSGGSPLLTLPPGTFLELVLNAARPHAGTVDTLALLKHPFAACGSSTIYCRQHARESETKLRQGGKPAFETLAGLLEPITANWQKVLPLVEHIEAHIAVAEAIASTQNEKGGTVVWKGEAGGDTASWLDEWRDACVGFPPVKGSDYAELFATLAQSKVLRSTAPTHPRLSILGPLEARLIDADLIVLGGMNEGAWPPDAGFDPWMSRPMRKKFRLTSPEFRIGLAAHDFAQLACAKEVLLTRSSRINGTPTVPSRFLLQLDAVLRAAKISTAHFDALGAREPWRAWADALDRPGDILPCQRPSPRPPVASRPKRLTVTEIATWLRNPYAIYAKHILKLHKLEELDAELDASDRGIMIHTALEKFSQIFGGELPNDAEDQLLQIGRHIFAREEDNPRVRAFWWARFLDIAAWFIIQERARRQSGITVLEAEAIGEMTIDGLTLRGRVDRIDRFSDGRLAIIDYKTGAVPAKIDVIAGIEPQLQLLALMAVRGGFEHIPPSDIGSMDYWVLKGGASGCKTTSFTKEIDELVEQAEAGLRQLIATFADPTTAYEAVPKPRFNPRYNDYAHLSRLSEWGKGGDRA